MTKPKVIILGATGMLGAITLDSFVKSGDFIVEATRRGDKTLEGKYPKITIKKLDAESDSTEQITHVIKGNDWVVNAIGVIKPYIKDDDPNEVERAILVNSLFPHKLAQAAKKTGAKVLQIATDCVYSGEKGMYTEEDKHDAIDVYGKTKSLGEAYKGNIFHLRCSIIGPEIKAHMSLLDWFLGQPQDASVNGYTNHRWNGVTTLHFSRICQGIIKNNINLPHCQHMVPSNFITKANLLKAFAKEFDRSDIKVNEAAADKVIDRTLQTSNESLNKTIWQEAGYQKPPTIEKMVEELAGYNFVGN